jgi:hypothetical protein
MIFIFLILEETPIFVCLRPEARLAKPTIFLREKKRADSGATGAEK